MGQNVGYETNLLNDGVVGYHICLTQKVPGSSPG